ncbi:MAG: hypothetical protein AAF713_18880 [Pseudomonadota bacterium]
MGVLLKVLVLGALFFFIFSRKVRDTVFYGLLAGYALLLGYTLWSMI